MRRTCRLQAERHQGSLNEFELIKSRPKLIEAIRLALEERNCRSSLDRGIMAKIHRTVEQALPKRRDDMEGFHTRLDDPIEDFAFVGTRYAFRTTKTMIDVLRGEGFDDLGLLDLAIAIPMPTNGPGFIASWGCRRKYFI